MTEDVLGLIPARGGSKGIPRKNVVDLAGEPLIAHTIRAANEASTIDRTVVSTDDEEICEVATDSGADAPFLRPADLATDEAPTEPVVTHALEYLGGEGTCYETVVLLQPTSPLRDATAIDEALDRHERAHADSLVSVSVDHRYRWERTGDGADRKNSQERRARRQDKDPEFVENGAIYAVETELFRETENLQAGRTALYVMDEADSVDIDTEFDLWLAEKILTEWKDD